MMSDAMSDELFCTQNNPDPQAGGLPISEPQIGGVTRQVASLARALDRLPPGIYFVELEKATRFDPWKAVIKDMSGEHVREMELRSEATAKQAPERIE